MRWPKIMLTAACLGAAVWNLYTLWERVRLAYARPLEARVVAGMRNMEGMYALAARGVAGAPPSDGTFSKNGVRPLTIGTWYPFDDPISVMHMNMTLAYYLYPAHALAATPATFGRLDFITGYRAHLCQLAPELGGRRDGGRFGEFSELAPGEGKFFLLGRPAIRLPGMGNGEDALPSIARQDVRPPVPPWARPWRVVRLLLAMGALPLVLGWLFLRGFPGSGLCLPAQGGMGCALFAWASGILLLVLLLPPLALMGMPVTPGAFAVFYALALAGLWLVGAWRGRRPGASHPGYGALTAVPSGAAGVGCADAAQPGHGIPGLLPWLPVVLALAWVGLLLAHVLAAPMSDITGIGVWGLKAKAFVLSGGADRTLLADPDYGFCQQSYPLGFPLLLAWCHVGMGAYDDWAIRLVPMALGMGVCWLLFAFLRRLGAGRAWAGLLALLFCTGETFSRQATFVQAEMLLLLLALAGVLCLVKWWRRPHETRHLCLGFLFLAGAANVKQEGLVYFAVFAILATFWARWAVDAGLGAGEEGSAGQHAQCPICRVGCPPSHFIIGTAILVLALFIAPWQVWCRWHRLPVNDFSLTAALHRPPRVLLECWGGGLWAFGRQMFWTWSSTALIWCSGLVVLAWSWWRRHRNQNVAPNGADAILLAGAAAAIVLFFGTAYVFSVFVEMGRLEWHLEASGRLLLFPTALFLAGVVMAKRQPN